MGRGVPAESDGIHRVRSSFSRYCRACFGVACLDFAETIDWRKASRWIHVPAAGYHLAAVAVHGVGRQCLTVIKRTRMWP